MELGFFSKISNGLITPPRPFFLVLLQNKSLFIIKIKFRFYFFVFFIHLIRTRFLPSSFFSILNLGTKTARKINSHIKPLVSIEIVRFNLCIRGKNFNVFDIDWFDWDFRNFQKAFLLLSYTQSFRSDAFSDWGLGMESESDSIIEFDISISSSLPSSLVWNKVGQEENKNKKKEFFLIIIWLKFEFFYCCFLSVYLLESNRAQSVIKRIDFVLAKCDVRWDQNRCRMRTRILVSLHLVLLNNNLIDSRI